MAQSSHLYRVMALTVSGVPKGHATGSGGGHGAGGGVVGLMGPQHIQRSPKARLEGGQKTVHRCQFAPEGYENGRDQHQEANDPTHRSPRHRARVRVCGRDRCNRKAGSWLFRVEVVVYRASRIQTIVCHDASNSCY